MIRSLTISKDTASRDLNLSIRAKLALYEKLPSKCDVAKLDGGVLVLIKNNLFQLAFTLSHPDSLGIWKPLSFKLIFNNVHEYIPSKSIQNTLLEFKAFDCLLKIYFSSMDKFEKVQVDSNKNNQIKLDQLWNICYHLSLMHVLRVFYIQTQTTIKHSEYSDFFDINFLEESDRTLLIFKFWKSHMPE